MKGDFRFDISQIVWYGRFWGHSTRSLTSLNARSISNRLLCLVIMGLLTIPLLQPCGAVAAQIQIAEANRTIEHLSAEKRDSTAERDGEQTTQTRTGYDVTLFGGVSIPLGDFSAPSGGAAKTGFAVGADGSLALSSALSWMSSVNLSVNSLDIRSVIKTHPSSRFSTSAGSWTLVWALTGLRVSGNVSPQAELFGFGQAGLLWGTFPRISDGEEPLNFGSATAFGFAFGGGMTISCPSLSVRYLSGEPQYELTLPECYIDGKKAPQPTSCLLITGGVTF